MRYNETRIYKEPAFGRQKRGKMKRRVVFTGTLTAEERSAVMRFALEIGDAASCRTNALLRPLTMDLLEGAFREREAKIEERERAYVERARTFDPAKASPEMRAFFGGDVTAEKYGKYIADLIKQEEEAKRVIRGAYHVTVDYADVTKEDLAFHAALQPRVTFGETNELHEACSFSLTRELKDALMDSSLGGDPEEGFDYGAFYLGASPLYYEDLCVTADGETVLSTVSHEGILDLFLSDEDLVVFRDFELNKSRNYKIAKKLLS